MVCSAAQNIFGGRKNIVKSWITCEGCQSGRQERTFDLLCCQKNDHSMNL